MGCIIDEIVVDHFNIPYTFIIKDEAKRECIRIAADKFESAVKKYNIKRDITNYADKITRNGIIFNSPSNDIKIIDNFIVEYHIHKDIDIRELIELNTDIKISHREVYAYDSGFYAITDTEKIINIFNENFNGVQDIVRNAVTRRYLIEYKVYVGNVDRNRNCKYFILRDIMSGKHIVLENTAKNREKFERILYGIHNPLSRSIPYDLVDSIDYRDIYTTNKQQITRQKIYPNNRTLGLIHFKFDVKDISEGSSKQMNNEVNTLKRVEKQSENTDTEVKSDISNDNVENTNVFSSQILRNKFKNQMDDLIRPLIVKKQIPNGNYILLEKYTVFRKIYYAIIANVDTNERLAIDSKTIYKLAYNKVLTNVRHVTNKSGEAITVIKGKYEPKVIAVTNAGDIEFPSEIISDTGNNNNEIFNTEVSETIIPVKSVEEPKTVEDTGCKTDSLLRIILKLITSDINDIDYDSVLKDIKNSIEDNDTLCKYIVAGVSKLSSKQQVDILLDGMNKLGI